MDTVDYTDAGVRQMKGVQHLSNWKLIIPLLLLTSYTACDISTPSSVPELADFNKQSENLTTCTAQTVSFTWAYEIQPFFVVEWYFENILIAQTSEESFSQDDIIINPNYTDRFHLQTKGKVGFTLSNVTKSDTGTYRCIVTLKSTDSPKEFRTNLQVTGTELGNYTITVTNTTKDCRTLKCGEPVGTKTTYKWSSKVDCKPEERNRTTTITFKLCPKNFNYSVKCQRVHDCTETRWQRFTRPPGSNRRKTRTLDEQLDPCGKDQDSDEDTDSYEDTDSGNVDDSSPMTIGIAVAVVAVVAVVIAISTVVIRRKPKSRAGRRPDSFKVETPACTECLDLVDKTHQPDKETCEQVNLNQKT